MIGLKVNAEEIFYVDSRFVTPENSTNFLVVELLKLNGSEELSLVDFWSYSTQDSKLVAAKQANEKIKELCDSHSAKRI